MKERVLFYLQSSRNAGETTAPLNITYFADIMDDLLPMAPEDPGERNVMAGAPLAMDKQLRPIEEAGIMRSSST